MPDVSQLSASGGRVQLSQRGPQREGYSQEGVTGLANLGVRDLTYKVMRMLCVKRLQNSP